MEYLVATGGNGPEVANRNQDERSGSPKKINRSCHPMISFQWKPTTCFLGSGIVDGHIIMFPVVKGCTG